LVVCSLVLLVDQIGCTIMSFCVFVALTVSDKSMSCVISEYCVHLLEADNPTLEKILVTKSEEAGPGPHRAVEPMMMITPSTYL
jgi:hypothetical protein